MSALFSIHNLAMFRLALRTLMRNSTRSSPCTPLRSFISTTAAVPNNHPKNPNPLATNALSTPAVLALLDDLHAKSLAQEANFDLTAVPEASFKSSVVDKFIALDQDKAQFVYTLARAIGARNIVEAGTSFGVSTIYLALAVAANTAALGGSGRVVATEHEPTKAAQAVKYWKEAGVREIIDLREGDLRETLTTGLESVDMLLLDIWAPMALPALRLVEPHLRPGAIVIVDNTIASGKRYADLFAHIAAEGSNYTHCIVPFDKGLSLFTYHPRRDS